jgi:hypothetical protein
MVTVRDLLCGNADYQFEVLAGHRGLDKEVRAISFIDAPSSVEWLRGREVILTTAFLYQTDDNSLQYFVKELINKNVSALGIKLGRYIKAMPASILEIADANMFPIFVLPLDMVWSEFIEKFYQRGNTYEDAERYLKCPLSSLMARIDAHGGEDDGRLRHIFTDSLNVPAAIVDNSYNILSKNSEPGAAEIERFCESLRGQPAVHVFRMQTTMVDNITYLDVVISDAEHLIIASANTAVSVKDVDLLRILYHSSKKRKLLKNSRDFLMRSLLEGIVFSGPQTDLREISQQIGIDYSNSVWIVIAAGEQAGQGRARCKKVFEKILGPRDCVFFHIDAGIQENRHYVIFVSLRAPQVSKEDLSCMVRRAFTAEDFSKEKYQLFFSGVCGRFDDLRKCYAQAQKTYQYYQALGVRVSAVYEYRDIQPFEYLLHTDISLHEISGLARKITTFDAIQALELYLEYNNIRLAAEANYVHENTMRYRINKTRAEVACDLNNPVTRLTLLLKIKLWRIKMSHNEIQE